MRRSLRRLALAASLLAGSPSHASPPACGTLSSLREAVAAASNDAGRAARLEAFVACAQKATTPLLEPGPGAGFSRAVFVFRGEARSLALAGDANGWDQASHPFERLAGSDVFVTSLEVPDTARLDYKLVRDGKEWLLDPWNPWHCVGGFGPNSELRMPAYRPPEALVPPPSTPRGRWSGVPVESRALGNSRTLVVRLPPGYGASGKRHPVLYLLDGPDYRDLGNVHDVVEALLPDGRAPEALLVLVPALDRRGEYERSAAFERFLVDEAVPAVDARFLTRTDPAGRGVMGVSLGGFAALSAAARNPGVFGRCGAQSTGNAFPRNLDALVADLERLPAPAVRFHLDVGAFEDRFAGGDVLSVSRRLHAVLVARGATVQYREVPEGHSWCSWRARIGEALRFFWELPAPGQPASERLAVER